MSTPPAKAAPAAAAAPKVEQPPLSALHRTFQERAADCILGPGTQKNHPQFLVRPERIHDAVRIARDLGFHHLALLAAYDICPPGIIPLPPGAKEPTVVFGGDPRIEVVYNFFDYDTKNHLSLKVQVPRDGPVLRSITDLYRGADWLEREVWDLLGVRFEGHPFHKRLLLPEGWVGHPLRKDYDRTKEQFVALDPETGEDVVSFQEGAGW
jgi:NADH-quinone oxidoreductase subunit C